MGPVFDVLVPGEIERARAWGERPGRRGCRPAGDRPPPDPPAPPTRNSEVSVGRAASAVGFARGSDARLVAPRAEWSSPRPVRRGTGPSFSVAGTAGDWPRRTATAAWRHEGRASVRIRPGTLRRPRAPSVARHAGRGAARGEHGRDAGRRSRRSRRPARRRADARHEPRPDRRSARPPSRSIRSWPRSPATCRSPVRRTPGWSCTAVRRTWRTATTSATRSSAACGRTGRR